MLPKNKLVYGSNVESSAARSYRSNIQPQNGTGTYNAGDTITINIPTRNNLVLVLKESVLKFTLTYTAGAASEIIRLDSCGAHGVIDRIRVWHGSNLLEDITSYAVLAKMKDVPNDSLPNNTGTGTIRLVDASNEDLLNVAYGSINYGTGELSINSLDLLGYPSDTFDIRITATVQDEYLDVAVSKNQIILLDDSSTNIDSNRLPGLTVNVISV
jgi:hypothetical protein